MNTKTFCKRMLSADDALLLCTEDLFHARYSEENSLNEERQHRESRRSDLARVRESLRISPRTVFPQIDDISLIESNTLDSASICEPADLLNITKNYFRKTVPGHFQKKILNAYLQRYESVLWIHRQTRISSPGFL